MANFCHQCALAVDPEMVACPSCGAHLSRLGVIASLPVQSKPESYPAAPLPSRVLAFLIDSLISAAFSLPAGVMFLVALAVGSFTLTVIAAVLSGLGVVAGLIYLLVKDAGGASRGKRVMHLMVVHLPSNAPCNRRQSALRSLVLLALNLLPTIGWVVELAAALLSPGGRRLGDRAAETQVVETSQWRPGR